MKFFIVSILLNLIWLVMAGIAFVAYWGWLALVLVTILSVIAYGLLFIPDGVLRAPERSDG